MIELLTVTQTLTHRVYCMYVHACVLKYMYTLLYTYAEMYIIDLFTCGLWQTCTSHITFTFGCAQSKKSSKLFLLEAKKGEKRAASSSNLQFPNPFKIPVFLGSPGLEKNSKALNTVVNEHTSKFHVMCFCLC